MVEIKFSRLYKLIRTHFNINELKTLCLLFSPQVDFEDLGALEKSGKVRELIEYCRRHDQLVELVLRCKDQRPKVDWSGTITTNFFTTGEIQTFIEQINWGLKREGYLSNSPLTELKEKLFYIRDSVKKLELPNQHLIKPEVELLLETIHENIVILGSYKDQDITILASNKRKAQSISDLTNLQKKLEDYLKIEA